MSSMLPPKLPAQRKPPKGGSSTENHLEIVSDCPKCGAPIYGRKTFVNAADVLAPQFTCTCRLSTVQSLASQLSAARELME